MNKSAGKEIRKRIVHLIMLSLLLIGNIGSILISSTAVKGDTTEESPVETKLTISAERLENGKDIPTFRVSATLLASDGEPIKGASIRFLQNGVYGYSRTTGTAGIATFDYSVSQPGDYIFSVEYRGSTINKIQFAPHDIVYAPKISVIKQAQPTELSATPSLRTVSNGKILGTNEGQEFAIGNINTSTSWNKVAGNEIINLSSGSVVSVRQAGYYAESTYYLPSDSQVLTIAEGRYLISPQASVGVLWENTEPKIVTTRTGSYPTAQFKINFSEGYEFSSVSLSAEKEATAAFDPATSILTIDNITRDQQVTVNAVYTSDPIVGFELKGAPIETDSAWINESNNTDLAAKFSDQYNGIKNAKIFINNELINEINYLDLPKTEQAVLIPLQEFENRHGLFEKYEIKIIVENGIDRVIEKKINISADRIKPQLAVSGNFTDKVHKIEITTEAITGVSGIQSLTVNGVPINDNQLTINQNGSYNFELINGAGEKVNQVLEIENITPVKATLTLAIKFRDSSRLTADKPAAFGDYTATLIDEYGSPINDAKIYFKQDSAAPGSRLTNINGIASGYGSSFQAGDYLIAAEFRGGEINGTYYEPATASQTIHVKNQEKPVIYDYQVLAASGENDGQIFNLDESYEYIEWIETIGNNQEIFPVIGDKVSGLKPTIYSFRKKQYYDENNKTIYLPSSYYQLSIPNGLYKVTAKADPNAITWNYHTQYKTANSFVLNSINIAPINNVAYFNALPNKGYSITAITTDADSNYVKEIIYDEDTGNIEVKGISRNIVLTIHTSKDLPQYNEPANLEAPNPTKGESKNAIKIINTKTNSLNAGNKLQNLLTIPDKKLQDSLPKTVATKNYDLMITGLFLLFTASLLFILANKKINFIS